MSLIAKQTYSKVVREVNSTEQKHTEQERTMYLYDDKIVTQYREFKVYDVLDISYRFIGDDGGCSIYTLIMGYILISSDPLPRHLLKRSRSFGKHYNTYTTL